MKKYIVENKEIDFYAARLKKIIKFIRNRPKDIFRQFNIMPSTIVGFYIKLASLRKVGLLNISYKIQSDYDWLYRIIVINKMKNTDQGDEVFGDLGSKFSSNFSFFSGLINELKIRFNNNRV